jgi:hypothetical protein
MLTQNGLATFKARIENELADVREVVTRIDKKFPEFSQRAPNDFVVAGFAGYLYHSYNRLDKIFRLIANCIDEFEPRDEDGDEYNLLRQMSFDIKDVRPAILSHELASTLRDYQAFHQFFLRHYVIYLDWNEIKSKAEKLKPTFEKVEAAFQQFFVFLKAASEQIE